MKNQQNQNGRTSRGIKRERRKSSEEYEDEDNILRELRRIRAKVADEMKSHQKLAGNMTKGITEIGQKLKEGTIRPERLEFKKRVYNDFVRLLPDVRESLVKSKLEFDTCSSLIHEMESSMEGLKVSDSNPTCAAASSAVAAERNE